MSVKVSVVVLLYAAIEPNVKAGNRTAAAMIIEANCRIPLLLEIDETCHPTLRVTAGSRAVARGIGPKVAITEATTIITGTSANVPESSGLISVEQRVW